MASPHKLLGQDWMKCGYPIHLPAPSGFIDAPCGQCMPCRINKRRLWTGKMILENNYHEESTFLTLTYNEEFKPTDGQLKKRDVADFLNRSRHPSHFGPYRYFLVGEYGDQNDRPHYHAIMFGVSPEKAARQISKIWCDPKTKAEKGFHHIGGVTEKSIAYTAGYCLKKLTKPDAELGVSTPEFANMSRRPPLGYPGIRAILRQLQTDNRWRNTYEDVPTEFRTQGKRFPLGRYWRDYLRKELSIDKAPTELIPWEVELSPVYQKEKLSASQTAEKLWNTRRNHNRPLHKAS